MSIQFSTKISNSKLAACATERTSCDLELLGTYALDKCGSRLRLEDEDFVLPFIRFSRKIRSSSEEFEQSVILAKLSVVIAEPRSLPAQSRPNPCQCGATLDHPQCLRVRLQWSFVPVFSVLTQLNDILHHIPQLRGTCPFFKMDKYALPIYDK